MDNVFVYGGWEVRLDAGLPLQQAKVLPKLCADMTTKMIAKEEGVSPVTITKRIERAKFSLGMQRSVLGLCMEAIRREIIRPVKDAGVKTALVLMLGLATTFTAFDRPVQRPVRPVKVASVMRAQRLEVA